MSNLIIFTQEAQALANALPKPINELDKEQERTFPKFVEDPSPAHIFVPETQE